MTEVRRVRRLALRAPSEALVRRGALLLEDALRTASWAADVPGRVIVVKRLDVGAIRPNESPSALSARVEERLHELGARMVHALAPGAERADVVYFRDAVEAAAALAEHAGRTPEPAPWFLARAVPAYRPGAGPRHALRAALAAALEASPAGAVALVEALLARGTAGPLLDALEERDGPVLLAALGIAGAQGAQDGLANIPARGPGVPERGPVVPERGPGVPERGPVVPERGVLETERGVLETERGVLETERGVRKPERGVRKPERGVLETERGVGAGERGVGAGERGVGAGERDVGAGERDVGAGERGPVVPEGAFSVPAGGPAGLASDPERALPSVPEAFRAALAERVPAWGEGDGRSAWLAAAALLARSPALRHDPRLAARAAALARSPAGASREGSGAARVHVLPAEGAWSAWGGLLFLVPLLARLGLPALLAAHPALAEAGLPVHLLRDVARRLDAPPDDPILVALGDPPGPLPDAPFVEPASFALGAPSGPLPDAPFLEPASFALVAGPPPRASIASPPPLPSHGGLRAVAVLRTALRRTARRVVRTGLRSLVQRPGRVFATRTHLDVAFDLRRAHLGIRRAGADIDPGWVPWLGRVVTFHYRHGEEAHG